MSIELFDTSMDAVSGIECNRSNTEVIELGGDSELYQTFAGMKIRFNTKIHDIPANCPLLLNERMRELSNFVVCLTCPHAEVEDNFFVEL
jgi:hypothetical protein